MIFAAMKNLPLALMLLFLNLKSFSQQTEQAKFKSVGFTTGYGFGENTSSKYRPLFFAADLAYQLSKNKVQGKPFFTWYLEPQFNLVFTERPVDYEFGTNIGLRGNIMVSPKFYVYGLIGSGPHYFSAEVRRQSTGFLFSDNFAVGTYTQINSAKSLFLNLQFRFRHLSNASLKKPNGGINTFNIMAGILRIRNS